MDSFDQIIESDFDVKLLCQHDAGSLFYAFKNEAVHFITHVNNVLDQCYVTRFELAMGFNYLEQFAEIGSHRYEFAKKPDFKLSHDASQGDRYIMHWGEHEFVLDNEGGSGDFFNAVNEDLVAYRECYDQLDNLSEEEIVNRYFTDEILPYSLSVERSTV